jgi:membrane-associated phospholipid phosphatase
MVSAGAALVALMTADVLAGGLLTSLDRSVHDATAPTGDAPGWTDAVSTLGKVSLSGPILLIVAILTMQVLRRWWPGVLAAANLVALAVIVGGLKLAIGRTGPDGTEASSRQPGFFPSGHTATSAICLGTAIFLVLSWRSHGRDLARAQRAAALIGLALGVAVGCSVIFGGHHWLSDVLASLVIAAVVLQVSFARCRRYVDQPSDVPQRV